MKVYHCSPEPHLKILKPYQPVSFNHKPKAVYLTTSLPMALMYGIRHFEYTYGYDKEKQIFYMEYHPDALKKLYQGKKASLYVCEIESGTSTRIPNEVLSENEVEVIEEIVIDDVYQELLRLEQQNELKIYRYEELSEKHLNVIKQQTTDVILEDRLLESDSPKAEYYRKTYPESWESAKEKKNETDAL